MLRRGIVLDQRRRPVRGARVSVEWGTASTTDLSFGTDGDGRFEVALPTGRFRLGAYGPDGARGSVEAVVREGETGASDLVVIVG